MSHRLSRDEAIGPREHPRIVELVGPAGAGKSSLLRALHEGPDAPDPTPRPRAWDTLRKACGSWRPFVDMAFRGRWPRWSTLRSTAYLQLFIEQGARGGGRLHVLDHGPIFRVVLLDGFDPHAPAGPRFKALLDDQLSRWRDIVDLIVYVDAPDTVLVDRIRERSQEHELQDRPRPEAVEWLRRYRQEYRRVIGRIAGASGPPVLELSSANLPPDELAERVRGELRRLG